MSRYRGPRVRILRRLGVLPGLTNKTPQSKSSYINQPISNKKVSQYRIRLEEKQKLRFHYGITERQLLKYVRIARRAKGSTARQLVNHRHILVNDHTVNIPSYRCKPQDFITIKDRQKSQAIITRSMDYSRGYKTPNHLTLDSSQKKGSVNQIIDRESIGLKINELLVVEYYSRQA
ncbi:unnamed protein product [Sphagnum compactum]